jgi:hypothetical protein
MSIKDYRRTLERNVETAKTALARTRPQNDASAEPQEELMLRVLVDPASEPDRRVAAIHALKGLAFASPNATKFRPRLIEGLRAATEDERVRPAAVRTLVELGDTPTRERLLAGLRKPNEALVPAADAFAMLASDGHADAIPEARKAVDRGKKNASEVQPALAILARDPASKKRLHRLITNAHRPDAHRRAAAQSLLALDKAALVRASRALPKGGKVKGFVDGLATLATASSRPSLGIGAADGGGTGPKPARSAKRPGHVAAKRKKR